MILQAENISKNYETQGLGKISILKNINFHLDPNDFMTILGKSGAGKSTLLNILAGIDTPDEGNIYYYFDGKTYNFAKEKDELVSKLRNKYIGFIFQFHNLLPEFTAYENIILPALIGNKKEKEYKEFANELIAKIGLENRVNHKPKELSGGEQQRVAIARALINQPKIIFADEPTGNLDEKNTENILSLITDLKKEYNFCVVMATHNTILTKISNKTITISDGQISFSNQH